MIHEKTCEACPYWVLTTKQQDTIHQLVRITQAAFPIGFDQTNYDPEQIGVRLEDDGFSFYLYHSKMPTTNGLRSTLETVTDFVSAYLDFVAEPAKNRCRVHVKWNITEGGSV
jgi:hypothetical protein